MTAKVLPFPLVPPLIQEVPDIPETAYRVVDDRVLLEILDALRILVDDDDCVRL